MAETQDWQEVGEMIDKAHRTIVALDEIQETMQYARIMSVYEISPGRDEFAKVKVKLHKNLTAVIRDLEIDTLTAIQDYGEKIRKYKANK